MVEHSPEAIKIVRRYARVTPGTAQRMLDALLEQGGPDSLGDETAPSGPTTVETPVVDPGGGVPDGFEPLWFEADDLQGAVYQAVGAASVAWENPGGAGVFDDLWARRVAEGLLEWIDAQPVRLDPSGPTVRSLVETLSAAQSRFTASKVDVDKRETRIAHLQYLIDVLDPDGAESPHEPQAWGSPDDTPPAHRAEGGADDGQA